MKNLHDSWNQFKKFQNQDFKNHARNWLPLLSEHSQSWKNQTYPTGEEWKYVQFEKLSSLPLCLPTPTQPNQYRQDPQFFSIEINDFSGPCRLKKNSTMDGLGVKTHLEEIESSKDSPLLGLFKKPDNPFSKMALSFMGSGLVLRIKPGVNLEKPVKITFHLNAMEQSQVLSVFHLFVENGMESSGQIFLEFQGQQFDGLNIFRLDLNMAKDSRMEIFSKEKGGPKSHFIYNLQADVQASAQFRNFDFTLPGQWTRHNLQVELKDKQAQGNLNGIYLNCNDWFCDHHTSIHHQARETLSSENYRGILTDQTQAVFNGKILIDSHAAKSQSEQINKNLMLSKKAQINTKPELQIHNDDVKAVHGATIGQLDEEQRFYLESRGYNREQSLKTLSKAFVFDLIHSEKDSTKEFYFDDLNEILSRFKES